MKKTREGLKILGKRARGNPLLRGMVGEERVNLRAEVLIRRAREEAGLTQAELARRIGATQSATARQGTTTLGGSRGVPPKTF